MTNFHFICDNKTQRDVLKECGVKNISVSYKFVKKDYALYREMFQSLIISPGVGKRNFTSTEYNEFLQSISPEESFNLALQYDEPGETKRTMSYYHEALEQGLDYIVPILCEDYMVHLNYIKPILKSDILALGKGRDIESEDKDYEQIQGEYQIHGLSKARWLKFNTPPASVDSTTWLNPVKNGKLMVYLKDGVSEISVRDIKVIQEAMEENKDFAEKCNLRISQLATKDHKAFLKAGLALYYMPLFANLNMLSSNFI